MRYLFVRAGLLAVVFTASSISAHAQYRYPGGYGGWGGWGGGETVQGSVARGMGVYAGDRQYLQRANRTARTRSVRRCPCRPNWLPHIALAITRRNAANEMKHMARRKNDVNETAEKTYSRLHDNPSPGDIHRGDALNVVL